MRAAAAMQAARARHPAAPGGNGTAALHRIPPACPIPLPCLPPPADAMPALLDAPEHVAAASDSNAHPAGRRLLVERPAGSLADAALVVDPTPEATLVAEAFQLQAEQLVAALAAAGLRLTPDVAQRHAALDAIAAAVKAAAAEVVADTRQQMAALAAELRPAEPSPAGQLGHWMLVCVGVCRLYQSLIPGIQQVC